MRLKCRRKGWQWFDLNFCNGPSAIINYSAAGLYNI